MQIHLQPVTEDNYQDVIHLEVNEDQRSHVGAITEFLARAYVKGGGMSYFPFGIYNGDTLVGFTLYAGAPDNTDYHYICGFLIDKRFQRQGFGKAALSELMRFVRTNTPCQILTVTVHPGNTAAKSLYAQAGFRAENRLYEGEEVYSTSLR